MYHIDEGAVRALTNYYKSEIKPGSAILDICSSWVSHYPSDFPKVLGSAHPTHFSHMSHPTFPISHILICLFEIYRTEDCPTPCLYGCTEGCSHLVKTRSVGADDAERQMRWRVLAGDMATHEEPLTVAERLLDEEFLSHPPKANERCAFSLTHQPILPICHTPIFFYITDMFFFGRRSSSHSPVFPICHTPIAPCPYTSPTSVFREGEAPYAPKVDSLLMLRTLDSSRLQMEHGRCAFVSLPRRIFPMCHTPILPISQRHFRLGDLLSLSLTL